MINIQKSFKNKDYSFGNFYIISTPVGNLSDITSRAKEILSNVDLILCEDKRNTINLLNNYNIKNKLDIYHKFNEVSKSEYITDLILNKNQNIALVTDAGYPLISDPGSILVNKLIENNINIIPIPGASAFLLALVSSGLSTENFYFYGFLKNKTTIKKQNELKELSNYFTTIIFYESPKRILDTLKNIEIIFGDVKICVAKEITKLYESFYRGNVSSVIKELSDKKINGEHVILIENVEKVNSNEDQIYQELKSLKEKYPSLSNRDIIDLVSYKLNENKNKVYTIFNQKDLKNEK